MKQSLATLAVIALSISAFGQASLPEPAKVLGRYVGTWTLTFSAPSKQTYLERYEQVIGGNYIRKSVSPPNDPSAMAMATMQMLGFNKPKGVYQMWTFTTGSSFQSEGKWDAAAKVLTWTGQWIGQDGATYTSVVKTTVVDPDTDNISVLTTDSSGKVIGEQTGRRIRQK
jgi:hypothetical protein